MHKPTIADIPPSVLGSIFAALLVLAAAVAAWLGWLVWRSRRRTRARGLPVMQKNKTPRSQRVRRKKQ